MFCVPRAGAQDAIPERHLPALVDPQGLVLFAQRQRALIH
jgi:hypothetical protein